MRRFLTFVMLLSLLLNVWLAVSVFKTSPLQAKHGPFQPNLFTITNVADSTNDDEHLILFKNGKYWWTIDGNVISMNVDMHQGVTFRMDEATGRLKSTTVELLDTNGNSCAFTDMNADGIPDKKRMPGDGENWSIFYNGQFVPSFKEGKDRYITNSGTKVIVIFDGARWVEAK